MEPSNRCSKKDAKKQKIMKKQQTTTTYTRKEVEQQLRNLQDDKSDSQYQDPTLKRAMKWWQRVDQKYFKSISIEDAVNKRDICTSNQVLSLSSPELGLVLNYKQEMIYSALPSFAERNKIRVLFKSKNPYQYLCGIYGIQFAIPNYNTDHNQSLDDVGIKVVSKLSNNIMMDENQAHKLVPIQNSLQIKSLKLDLQQVQDNQIFCQRAIKINQLQSQYFYSQIDRQISLWEWELQRANQQNAINWNKLIKKLKQNPDKLKVNEMDEFDDVINKYRDKITWGTVLRSFQRGFKDKTKKMLQAYIQNQKNFNSRPPKGLNGTHQKKFFETDCKICFCSDNSESNQVLYCDSCNTSFHLACYGLTSVPLQDQYFCQRCTYNKKQQAITGAKPKKIYCQICFKTSFPMKNIDQHFYHVTCLILFNFVELHESKMILKGSLSHQNIMKMVVQNQIQHEECSHCRKIGGGTQLGMQIKCSYNGCQNSYHPICAYLNGCRIDLKVTKNKTLEVKMVCNDHLGSRMEQVYLRRYMCNLNQTSTRSINQFKILFDQQQQNLLNTKQNIAKTRKKYPNRILMMTRVIKNVLKTQQEKQQQIQTETQQILKKLKNKATNN